MGDMDRCIYTWEYINIHVTDNYDSILYYEEFRELFSIINFAAEEQDRALLDVGRLAVALSVLREADAAVN